MQTRCTLRLPWMALFPFNRLARCTVNVIVYEYSLWFIHMVDAAIDHALLSIRATTLRLLRASQTRENFTFDLIEAAGIQVTSNFAKVDQHAFFVHSRVFGYFKVSTSRCASACSGGLPVVKVKSSAVWHTDDFRIGCQRATIQGASPNYDRLARVIYVIFAQYVKRQGAIAVPPVA